jgi:CRP/FNR family transcriptional regulator, cyclic AMP receptor protein
MTSEPRRSFWSELSREDQRDLLRLGTMRHFPAGTALIRAREPTNHVLMLYRGCVKVISRGDGAGEGCQVVLAIRDAGEIVGEMSVMAGQPRSATVVAVRDVEAVVVPAGWFNFFIRSHVDAAIALQSSLCARLLEADRTRESAALDSVERRLAVTLLDLADRYGRPGPSGGIVVDLPLSQDDIAGLVLTSRRTLGRVLMRLRADRVLVTGRRAILIRTPAALRALAA